MNAKKGLAMFLLIAPIQWVVSSARVSQAMKAMVSLAEVNKLCTFVTKSQRPRFSVITLNLPTVTKVNMNIKRVCCNCNNNENSGFFYSTYSKLEHFFAYFDYIPLVTVVSIRSNQTLI